MRKLCKALALTLCAAMLISPLTAAGDSSGKTILTLEEAKEIALENDTPYKLQQSYINQKSDDFEDIYDMYKDGPKGIFRNKGERAKAEVASEMAIENAALDYKKEVFKKNDLKRQSDYDVTVAYYDVMKARLILDDAKRSMDLAKKELDVAKVKLEHGLITKNSFDQAENTYAASQTAYNKALTDVQSKMSTLIKEIGKDLDVSYNEIDMTISIPDIKSLDLAQIKKDYMEKNENYFLLNEQLKLAKYKQTISQEKYDEFTDEGKRRSTSDAMKAFDDLIYEANRDYDNTKYQYDEAIKALDIQLNSMYTGINTLAETIENLKKSIADTKSAVAQSKIMYDLGLISKNKYEKSESNLKDLENQLATSIINLNSQYLTLTQYSYTREK